MTVEARRRGGDGPAHVNVGLHLRASTGVEVFAYSMGETGPFVAVEIGEVPARVCLMFSDVGLLDRLRWALDQARTDLVEVLPTPDRTDRQPVEEPVA